MSVGEKLRVLDPVGDFALVDLKPAPRLSTLDGKVIGTVVSTIKDEKLDGKKLLVVRETDETGKEHGQPLVAVDVVDAGVGDLVLNGVGAEILELVEERFRNQIRQ